MKALRVIYLLGMGKERGTPVHKIHFLFRISCQRIWIVTGELNYLSSEQDNT